MGVAKKSRGTVPSEDESPPGGIRVTSLGLDGVRLIELKVWGDERGFFVERFRAAAFEAHGLPTNFAQDNHSRSAPGVMRGLHYQHSPWQRKLVGVVRGCVWDVIVDIRPDSPTFGRHVGLELSGTNGRLLWIPAGFAHGFCVLGEEPADILYKVDVPYNPATEAGLRWDDGDLSIHWPIDRPVVSERDRRLPSFAEFKGAPPEASRPGEH